MAIEAFVNAAQYTMVLEQFFELPQTPGALFWQNRIFLGLCALMMFAGIWRKRSAGELRASSAPESIAAALDPDRPVTNSRTRPRYDAPDR